MKKLSRNLVLILIISAILIPFIPIMANPRPAQDETLTLRFGTTSTNLDWDPTIYAASSADAARWATLENFVVFPAGWNGELELLQPMLATEWDIEFWPEELNTEGFINRGGIANITFTLREGVTFHDDSIWNATVAKWNIDRVFIVTGDLTGNGDTNMQMDQWEPAEDHLPFYTENWNMSHFIGQMPSYNGMVATDPNLLGKFPKIRQVVILDNGTVDGGGIIRIEYNEWNPFAIWDFLSGYVGGYIQMISMEAYKDYWDAPIYGYGNDPAFPQDETFQHLVGTGPYIFDHWTATGATTGGRLYKNENYWNTTALEARGWYELDEIDFVLFSPDQAGTDARNLAIDTDNLDFSYDVPGWSFDYDNVISQEKLVYDASEIGYTYSTCLTLNSINETYWKVGYDLGYSGMPYPDGIPRLFRKAISYAFDYDGYIQTAYNGRAWRMTGFLHINNTYANTDIPVAYLDLTIARQAMLAQFPTETAALGLTMSSTDAEWQLAASTDPIFTLNFYWDPTSTYTILKDYVGTALANIGCDFYDDTDHELTPTIWTHVSGGTFPYFSAQAWPLDWTLYANDIIHPFVLAYFQNPGDWTYDPYYNLGFVDIANVSFWLDEIYYSNQSRRQVLYDNIAEVLQTWHYSWLWIAQGQTGSVYRREWEMDLARWGQMGDFTYVRWVGWTPTPQPIPGYSIFSLVTASAASVGVIYIMMRKKKKLQ